MIWEGFGSSRDMGLAPAVLKQQLLVSQQKYGRCGTHLTVSVSVIFPLSRAEVFSSMI